MQFRRSLNTWSVCIVPALIIFLLLSQPAAAQGQATAGSNALVTMVKQVVLGAAQWGIEEAGVRMFGNSGWKLCKVALKPGLDTLQRRYPQLFDARAAGTPAAKSAAIDAAAWIQQDREFQATIAAQLKTLDQASREQLAMLIELKNQQEGILKKVDGIQLSVDRIERRLVVFQTQNPVRPEQPGQTIAQAENWYARAMKAKDLNERIRLFSEAIGFGQNTVNAYYERGNAYFDLKDFNSARADYTRTIALDRSFAIAYTNRGAASQNLDRFDDAIADYRASIRLDSAIPQNYDKLTEIYAERKDYAQVYAVAKLRLLQPADRATAYGAAAWWALFNRDFQNAIVYSQKGLAISPDEKWISTNLAHGYLFTGRFAEAEDIYLEYTGIKLAKRYWEEVILDDFRDLEAAGISHPRMNDLRVSLYGNLSYNLLFERRFKEAASYARMGLGLDRNAIWINSNLAHSLLLTNQVSQASIIYDTYVGSTVLGKRWERIILEDFAALKAGGISNASMDGVSARMLASMQRVSVGLR